MIILNKNNEGESQNHYSSRSDKTIYIRNSFYSLSAKNKKRITKLMVILFLLKQKQLKG